MKNKPLAKNVIISLGLIAGESAADIGIQKNIFESGMATLIIPNLEIYDIMKLVNSLESSGSLIKDVTKTNKG